MKELTREESGWILARVWLDAIEECARDFFGNHPRIFAEKAYEHASEAFIRIMENDYGIKAKECNSIKEALESYIELGVRGGLFQDTSQFVLNELTSTRVKVNVMSCPYLKSCKDMIANGVPVSNLTCARIGCFAAAARFLGNVDCSYEINAFNTEEGCQGFITRN